MADAKIDERGSLVCFLSLPEGQYLRLATLAKELGVSLDRYVSACLVAFEDLPDLERMSRVTRAED